MDGPSFHDLKIHAPPPGSSTDTSFPILTISILGIITTAILLLSYYVFVIKCCMNWRHSDVITRLTITSSRRRRQEQLVAHTAADGSHGLSESAIRAIPTFRFSTSRDDEAKQRPFHECAVCLNEFQEMERLRLLPSCLHVFHIDCIDTWLQTNANCPVCRSNITSTSLIPTMEHMGHGQHQLLHHSGRLGIEISGDTASDQPPGVESQVTDVSPSRIDNKVMKKLEKVCSMGDECINVRGKHDNYSYYAQPMRRSFSMNSSEDRQLYVLLQQILQHKLQNPHFQEMWQQNPRLQEVGSDEGSSNGNSGSGGSSRFRRTFFPFRHCRSFRSEALPIDAQV